MKTRHKNRRYVKSIHTLKILLSNLSLFIATSMLYILSILKNEENNININGNFEDYTNQNYTSIDSIF